MTLGVMSIAYSAQSQDPGEFPLFYARVVELADTEGLSPSAARRESSNLSSGTIYTEQTWYG